MHHPPLLDRNGNDIHTGAPPIYGREEMLLPHERYSDDDEQPAALKWAVLVIIVAGLAIFAWFALH